MTTRRFGKQKKLHVCGLPWAILILIGIIAAGDPAQAATVSLAWDPPPADPPVASYVVRYGTQSGQYATSVPCGLTTQCLVPVPDNQTYYFVVLAVGSGGQESQPSGEVVAQVGTGSVIIGVNQTSVSFLPQGGESTLNVMATTQWAAASNSPWLRIMPGSAATGNGVISYAVTPNAAPTPRAGLIIVGGVAVAVSQPAGPPTGWRLPTDLSAKDYDGDGKTDISIYRDTTGEWIARNSSGGMQYAQWGAPALDDIPVAADYDGDDRADVAVFRRATGQWLIRKSTGGSVTLPWGAPTLGDLPVAADYDGDGNADPAVYRYTTGQWLIYLSSGGMASYAWGAPALKDKPVSADYDGDGRADIAIYRQSSGQWFILFSGGGGATVGWGAPSLLDMPVPADYDGDGRTDIAVYRGTTGEWFILKSTGGIQSVAWGGPTSGDIPMPGDYDGDARADVAVYRTSTGQWLIAHSSGGSEIVGWGAPTLNDIVRGR
jgi:hypothetical protein